MSNARLAPAGAINLVRLVIVLAAVMAMMAAMAGSAFADGHSSSCSSPGTCASLINISHNDVDIVLEGTELLNDLTLVAIEDVAVASNNTLACNQIIALLSVNCSKQIANAILVVVPVSVKDVYVTILHGKHLCHIHI